MKILAIDPGTHCGWAVYDTELKRLLSSGTENLKTSVKISKAQRFFAAKQLFYSKINHTRCDVVVYEAVKRWMSSEAALTYCGIVAMLECEAWLESKNCIGFSPTEIKKFATKSGKATKEQMIEACKLLSGHTPVDDNEADAICLALLAAERLQSL